MPAPELINRYARRFAALDADGRHGVGSPLGAWLVLALAGPVATGYERPALEDALGTDVATAHDLLAGLLAHPHPAVAAALAAWTHTDYPGLRDWLAAAPTAVEYGAMPDQAAADAWTRRHTLGLIERFPVDLTGALITLVSTLATKVTWPVPFGVVEGGRLPGPWGERLRHVLHAGNGAVWRTEQAGLVATHTARADGLSVTSVIAEHTVPRADVLAAAHAVATASWAERTQHTVSLFDLPLGTTALWTITETQEPNRGEHVETVLPAWHAGSRHDLLAVPGLGFDLAARALMGAAGVTGPVEAVQAATAAYTRTGFEAAAVTVLASPSGAPVAPPPGPYRTAELTYGHPYAVVATTDAVDGPWRGLPVFAAWVCEPDDADCGEPA